MDHDSVIDIACRDLDYANCVRDHLKAVEENQLGTKASADGVLFSDSWPNTYLKLYSNCVAWYRNVHYFGKYRLSTVFLAIDILYELFGRWAIVGGGIPLICSALLSLCSKIEEVGLVKSSQFCKVYGASRPGHEITSREIGRMELMILRCIDWRCLVPTRYNFVACCQAPEFTRQTASEILMHVASSVELKRHKNSEVAVVAVVVANHISDRATSRGLIKGLVPRPEQTLPPIFAKLRNRIMTLGLPEVANICKKIEHLDIMTCLIV